MWTTSTSGLVDHGLGVGEGVLGAQEAGGGPSPLGRRRGDADEAGAGPAHGAGVDLADEPGSGDGDAQGPSASSGWCRPSGSVPVVSPTAVILGTHLCRLSIKSSLSYERNVRSFGL